MRTRAAAILTLVVLWISACGTAPPDQEAPATTPPATAGDTPDAEPSAPVTEPPPTVESPEVAPPAPAAEPPSAPTTEVQPSAPITAAPTPSVPILQPTPSGPTAAPSIPVARRGLPGARGRIGGITGRIEGPAAPDTVPVTPATPASAPASVPSPEPAAPPAPVPAAGDANPFDSLKAFIARMQTATGALRAEPERVEVGQRIEVTLTVSPKASETDLRTQLESAGAAVDVGAAKIAPRMRAQLVVPEGASVAVVGSEERAISDTDDTVWEWNVTPGQAGDLPIRARLTAPVTIDGRETPYDVRTFEANVTVFVTPTTRLRDFVENNWQWLWTVVIVPVFLWWRKRKTSPGTAA